MEEKHGFGFDTDIQKEFVRLYTSMALQFQDPTPERINKSNYIYARLLEQFKNSMTPEVYTSYIFGNFPQMKQAYLYLYLTGAETVPEMPEHKSTEFRRYWLNAIVHGANPKEVTWLWTALHDGWDVNTNECGLTRGITTTVYRSMKRVFPKLTKRVFASYFDILFGYSGFMCENIQKGWLKNER